MEERPDGWLHNFLTVGKSIVAKDVVRLYGIELNRRIKMFDKILMSEDVLYLFPMFVILAMFGIGVVHTAWKSWFK